MYSTIINRCYYCSYLYLTEWLTDQCNFKFKKKKDFDKNEHFITEHKQVRNALKDNGKSNISQRLYDLHDLRTVADYNPLTPLSENDLSKAIHLMEYIFKNIKFNS